MAKSSALINKAMMEQMQMKNILTSPETIELNKLYSQLGEILNKPTVAKNENAVLDMYYKILYRFMKLLARIQFGDTPQIPLPTPPPQPAPTPPQTPQKPQTPTPYHISSPLILPPDSPDDILADQFTSMHMAPQPPFASTPVAAAQQPQDTFATPQNQNRPPTTPESPPTPSLIAQTLAKVTNTKPKAARQQAAYKLLHFFKKHDNTFLFFPASQTTTIHGQSFPLQTVVNVAKLLKKPDLSATHIQNIDESHKTLLENTSSLLLSKGTTVADELSKALPGVQFIITQKPRGTRSQTVHTTKTLPILQESVLSGATTKLKQPGKLGTGKRSSKHLGKVHFKRWQKHIR